LRRRSSLLGRIAFGLHPRLGGVEELSGVFGGRVAPTPKAAKRVVEFFTAQVNNDHTRKAYLNAARRFAAWCEEHGPPRGIAASQDPHPTERSKKHTVSQSVVNSNDTVLVSHRVASLGYTLAIHLGRVSCPHAARASLRGRREVARRSVLQISSILEMAGQLPSFGKIENLTLSPSRAPK
jgi:hypothetical protein